MKIILCFLVLAGFVAIICAAPDDKPDAAKAAADAAAKAKKDAEDAAKKVKDATDAPAKAAKEVADDAQKAEKDAEKEVEKGAKDCVKPHKGRGHLGPLSAPIKVAEKVAVGIEETIANFVIGGLELWGL